MLALAEFHKGKAGFLAGMLLLSPSLVALKLNLLSAQKAKQLFLQHFFGGMSAVAFNHLCKDFSEQIIPSLIRKDAWKKLEQHISNGDKVVVVSASAEDWIAPWCIKNNIQYIGTRLHVSNSAVSGMIEGINCNGKEKVSRIKEAFNLADFENIYAYGDSPGDKEMLSIATHPNFRVFTS